MTRPRSSAKVIVRQSIEGFGAVPAQQSAGNRLLGLEGFEIPNAFNQRPRFLPSLVPWLEAGSHPVLSRLSVQKRTDAQAA